MGFEPAGNDRGRGLEEAARAGTRWAQPWATRLAKVGYLAKGAVYLLVGGLAFAAAFGVGGEATDPTGALVDISHAPAGRVALVLIGAGLLAHTAFRALVVVIDEPHALQGRWRRWGRRIKNAVSGLVYLGLAVTAEALALGWGGIAHTDHDADARHWSARLMAEPSGRPLLAAVAVGILVAAAVEVILAVGRDNTPRYLRTDQMSETTSRVVSALGRLAYLGRAAVLGSVGWFLAHAAFLRAPSKARGPAGALHGVWEQPHGSVLLGLVATGLIAFGLFAVMEARWRKLLEG